GTDAPEGHGASKRGIAFAAERGLDLRRHRAIRLTAEMADEADFIYGMDRDQIDGVRALSIAAAARTRLWEGEGSEIPDPHYESDQFFVAVGNRIESALPDRVDEILAEHARRIGP
ncbi:MAG: low molecular weight phosphatase family protein, partial [bacterium]|nr:low molecular weight phosphatase family protein [bacterium]